jgi:membrane fusion protein (multidrug efflux system)
MRFPRLPFPKLDLNWRLLPDFFWRALVIIVAAVILGVVFTRWNGWQGEAGWQTTDDAYLQADLTPIAAKVPGYVRELPRQEYAEVRAGDVLVQLVDDDYRALVAQAESNVAAAQAQVTALAAQRELAAANLAAANAVVAATTALVEQNTRDLERQQRLFATGSSSTEAGERLATTRAQLAAELDQHRAQALAASRELGVLGAQRAQAEAAIASQTANLAIARLNLSYTRIVAPQDGVIGQRQVKPGQYVAAGTQVTTLVPLPRIWVIANYKETQLTHMAIGNQAEIRVDAFPSHRLRGHLIAFAPAAGSQFALLPPDNATGNFTKVVQRFPVKIALDDTDGLGLRLYPGMSVVARVDAHDGQR